MGLPYPRIKTVSLFRAEVAQAEAATATEARRPVPAQIRAPF